MSVARNGRPGRPSVSVVMPFAGSRDEALAAIETLGRLHVLDGDELLLADNAGVLASTGAGGLVVRSSTGGTITITGAGRERSPAHARNAGAGAAHAAAEWILFLDADTVAPPDLLDRYFAEPIADDVGAIVGAIAAAPLGRSAGLVARYGAHKNFLDAGAHLAHPFMPRAAAANLLVRRAAFDAVGGFFEGLRAAEDTDFSWRLQRAGWRLIGRPEAVVEHRYRESVTALRRQWRAYAAGRAWLGRRYPEFEPRPALVRAAERALGRATGLHTVPAAAPAPSVAVRVAVRDRVSFAAIDGMLGVEELLGFAQPNRPGTPVIAPAAVVLVTERFPAPDVHADPGVRVEAAARPDRAESAPSGVTVTYREDDGPAERAAALLRLVLTAPRPTLATLVREPHAALVLAPAAVRLRADPGAAFAAADPGMAQDVRRLARLAGREPRS